MKKPQVISVVGAGGKTTFIRNQAKEYLKHGQKVLITTTTHMAWPEVACDSRPEEIRQHLEERGWSLVGLPVEHRGIRKMGGVPCKVLDSVISLADVVLIEADGSRRLPFKVPKPWEPVIHPATTKIVIMAGLAAADGPICECCYNWEKICRVLGKQPKERLSKDDMRKAVLMTYLPAFEQMGISVPVELKFVGKSNGWTYESERCFSHSLR